MKKLVLTLVLCLLAAGPAFAYTLESDGVTVEASANEPTTYTNGAPITDLTKIRYYWKLGATGQEFFFDQAAVSPTGKTGTATNRNIANIKVPHMPCAAAVDFIVSATAWTPTTEGSRSNVFTLPLASRQGECVPNAPSGTSAR